MNKTIIVMTLALALAPSIVNAAFIAQAGFNDTSGINSNATPNSPYTLGGLIAGSGAGEPGWAGPWQNDHNNVVETTNVWEGDGAAQLDPLSGTGRQTSQQLNGIFQIEQYVQFAAGARLVTYNEEAPGGNALQGPIWQAFPDGKFYVINGTGDAGSPPSTFSGFTWQPGVWYKIDVYGNMATNTWEFAVNDVRYPGQLGYRGTPTYINRVFYQSEGSGAVFLDAVTITPEPSTITIASIGIALLLTAAGRRRFTSMARIPNLNK